MQKFENRPKFTTAMTLPVLMAALSLHLSGQEDRNPFWETYAPAATSNQADWENDLRGAHPQDRWSELPAPDISPDTVKGPRTVSVDELRHPLSRKGRQLLDKAQKYVRAGDHARAMAELNLALKEPSAAPYAHGILGIEYLNAHRVTEAIAELSEGVALRPRSAIDHSNLGLALCMGGQTTRGLEEIEAALTLDPGLLRARFLKAVILMDRDSDGRETREYLRVAQREVPIAHLALALFYKRHGENAAAQQELQDFARLRRGITLTQAQNWLAASPAWASAGQALGLWRDAAVK